MDCEPPSDAGHHAISHPLTPGALPARSPSLTKVRSLSDGGGTPSNLSPSPHMVEASRRASKDDSLLWPSNPPSTPRRSDFLKGMPLQLPPRQITPPPLTLSSTSKFYAKPPPLSPKLDHSQIYASPTNFLPRRSRGLDFSRAATSLHHSTLAEQSSPDSSPTLADRAISIPSRRTDLSGPACTPPSLWSVLTNHNHDKIAASGSLGSSQAVGSSSSSSSDDADLMDQDMDDAYPPTPFARNPASAHHGSLASCPSGIGVLPGSPAAAPPNSFQHRQRPRKPPKKKKKKQARGNLGLGFNISASPLTRSPPGSSTAARRESISWQAKQLHISGFESDDVLRSLSDADGRGDGQRSVNVIRRAVTRRGNLLPKTKTFARIRAALAEEGAPIEAETRREAEVVKHVRESDVNIPPTGQEAPSAASALSSPNLTNHESADDMHEDDVMGDILSGLPSGNIRQRALKTSKVKSYWDTFSESSSIGGARITPPPAGILPRGSSSGVSEDAAMESPSLIGPSTVWGGGGTLGPSASEISRRVNNKRRHEDDFDLLSFKRRAVSPGMSARNSPVPLSPLQRDTTAWGSRSGSTGGDKGGSSAPSESGSITGTSVNPAAGANGRPNGSGKGRVGLQGMVDTNDGIMRMSIE